MKLLWIMLKGNLTYASNILCITCYALSLNNNACRNTVRSRRRMNEPAGWRVSVFLGSGGPLPPKMAKKGGINSVFSFFSIAIFLGRVSDLLFRGAPPPLNAYPYAHLWLSPHFWLPRPQSGTILDHSTRGSVNTLKPRADVWYRQRSVHPFLILTSIVSLKELI